MESSGNAYSNGPFACENKLVITSIMRFDSMFSFLVITVSTCAIQKPNPALQPLFR